MVECWWRSVTQSGAPSFAALYRHVGTPSRGPLRSRSEGRAFHLARIGLAASIPAKAAYIFACLRFRRDGNRLWYCVANVCGSLVVWVGCDAWVARAGSFCFVLACMGRSCLLAKLGRSIRHGVPVCNSNLDIAVWISRSTSACLEMGWSEVNGEILIQGTLFVGFISSVLALASWSIGLMVFRPFYETTAVFHVNARVRLSDLIILAIEIQILLAYSSWKYVGGQFNFWFLVDATVCILIVFWWVCGIRMLARGGVESSGARWLALGLLIPLGYVSTVVLMISAFVVPFVFTVSVIDLFQRRGGLQVGLLSPLPAMAAVLMLFVAHRTARRLVENARRDRAVMDGVHFVTDPDAERVDRASVER